MTAVQLEAVEKRFGGVTALRGLDLEIERGEVFGFLGPNGAGKSTTIDLLVRYSQPTAGTVRVLGENVDRDPVGVRRRVGILPEGFAPFETMTGRQHVEFAVDSKGADDDPDRLIERVGLSGAGDRRADGYSKGMTQRLALGMALAGDPDLLILDEPSTGLDPHGVRRMREIVREENERGATVFFSSHILEQVEAVCDRVGILRNGELVAVDSIEGLRASAGTGSTLTVELTGDPADLVPVVEGIEGVSSVTRRDGTLEVACSTRTKLAVLDEVRAAGGDIRDFRTAEASLEELFVSVTDGSSDRETVGTDETEPGASGPDGTETTGPGASR